MKLPSKIRFANEKVKLRLEELSKGKPEERRLYLLLTKVFENLGENAFCGIQISKKQIPQYYLKRYNIKNLWKYDLSGAWRLLYSIENQDIIVVSIILEWLSHKDYDNRFNY